MLVRKFFVDSQVSVQRLKDSVRTWILVIRALVEDEIERLIPGVWMAQNPSASSMIRGNEDVEVAAAFGVMTGKESCLLLLRYQKIFSLNRWSRWGSDPCNFHLAQPWQHN